MGQGLWRAVMKKRYLEAGEFVNTHGITGELRLYPWCDAPEFLCGFETFYLDEKGGGAVQVAMVRPHKNLCIVKLYGIDSIEQAHIFIGRTVYIDRQDAQLSPGHYFVQDMLGCRVVDADSGQAYGHVEEVTHPGRHDVWRILGEAGEYLFPAVEPFLVRLDIDEGMALVRPIEGMFEPEVSTKPTQKKEKRGGA